MKNIIKNKRLHTIFCLTSFFRFILCLVPCLISMGCTGAAPTVFNAGKAAVLSPETRKEFDLVFFNEVATWDVSSNRYAAYAATSSGPRAGFDKRDEEFRSMAEQGYLPAYVIVRLFRYSRTEATRDVNAIGMLIQAAEKGDVSSMCALSFIPVSKEFVDSINGFEESRDRFRNIGAEKKHGACLAARGNLSFKITTSADGSKITEKRYDRAGLPDLNEASRQGYYRAHFLTYLLYREEIDERQSRLISSAELERTLCWGLLAQQHSNWAGLDVFLSSLRYSPRATLPSALEAVLDAYDPRKISTSKKIVTPSQCLSMDEMGDKQ